MEKVKFEDLSFGKEKLKLEELAVLEGGINQRVPNDLVDGCGTGVCNDVREIGAGFCDGGAVCTSGIGVCNGKT
ncbi:hypothetical protein AGMMS50239_27820 [Bacteroidia bacterium]|nr:hypothetical protein AGMMS50239_27820 [Bacteroidia bacterium]